MIECSRLLEESKLITNIVSSSSIESVKCMDTYVLDFREDLIEAFVSHLKKNDFIEVDKLVQAYLNYKDFVVKRKMIGS